MLPGVALGVAVPARSGDILRRVIATVCSGMEMFRSAFKESCLCQRVAVSFGKCFKVFQPHWLAAIAASAALTVVRGFAKTNRGFVRHEGSFKKNKDEPR